MSSMRVLRFKTVNPIASPSRHRANGVQASECNSIEMVAMGVLYTWPGHAKVVPWANIVEIDVEAAKPKPKRKGDEDGAE